MRQQLNELLRSIDTLALQAIRERLTTEAIEANGAVTFDDERTNINLHGVNVTNDNPLLAICHFIQTATTTVQNAERCDRAVAQLKQGDLSTFDQHHFCSVILDHSKCSYQRQIAIQTMDLHRPTKEAAA